MFKNMTFIINKYDKNHSSLSSDLTFIQKNKLLAIGNSVFLILNYLNK